MRSYRFRLAITFVVVVCACERANLAPAADLDRTVLPIPEPPVAPITEIDARKAKAPPRFEVKAPEGRPERRHRPDRRHRLRPLQRLRRAVPDADVREAREQRAALQSLPHDGPLLADANRPADRPQPPRQQRRRHHGAGDGVPRQHRRAARKRHAAGGDPAPERLQHRRLRQVSRDAAVGSLGLGAVRPLADALGVRQVLRLHRRRDEPVGAGGLRRRRPRRGAARSQLPLHHRHDQPGHRLGPLPAGPDAGQAVLHVLRHRRDARPAPRPEGVHRQVQGQVRPGLGQASRGDAEAADRAGRRPGGHQADANARRRSRRGTRSRPTRSGCSPGRWRPSPASPSTPTTRSAGWCRRSRTWASWTTRCSSTSSATTARAPKAGRTAPTTRCSRSTASSATSPRSCRTSTSGAGRRPSRTSRSAGRTPATRRSSGPSRWRRTSAARATRWSSTGPRGSRPRAKCARSSIT